MGCCIAAVLIHTRVLGCHPILALQALIACAVLFNIAETYLRIDPDSFAHTATALAAAWVALVPGAVPVVLLTVVFLARFDTAATPQND